MSEEPNEQEWFKGCGKESDHPKTIINEINYSPEPSNGENSFGHEYGIVRKECNNKK